MSGEVVTVVIAAVVSAIAAVLSAVLSVRAKRNADIAITRLSSTLEESRSARDAQRDYEYDARRRLYSELQPALFELMEASEALYRRVLTLVRIANEGMLDLGRPSWLELQHYKGEPYALWSTIHRVVAPVAVYYIIKRRVTVVDLRVDPFVRTQYMIAKQMSLVFSSGTTMARTGVSLPYDPHSHDADPQSPSVQNSRGAIAPLTIRQDVPAGRLEDFAEALVVHDGTEAWCAGYGEFERNMLDSTSPMREQSSEFVRLFTDFHPVSRPVLWRLLVAGALMARAVMETYESGEPFDPEMIPSLLDEDVFAIRRIPPGMTAVDKDPTGSATTFVKAALTRLAPTAGSIGTPHVTASGS